MQARGVTDADDGGTSLRGRMGGEPLAAHHVQVTRQERALATFVELWPAQKGAITAHPRDVLAQACG